MTNVGQPVGGGAGGRPGGGGVPKWLIVVAAVLFLIVLVCCGGLTTCYIVGKRAATAVAEKASGITMNPDGKGFSVKTENGEMNLGGGSLPASFPTDVPVYGGLTPTMSFGDAKTGSGTVIFGGKAGASEVAGWYEEQMKAKGWTETGNDPFAATIERAVRYIDAGADCIFVPGVVEEDTIRRLAAEIPAPLNIVAGLANRIDAPTLFSLGVTRVSLGGSLARAALSLVERAGRELLDSGALGFLDGAISYGDLQRRFGP